jgi:hypothetical protein
MPLAAVCDIFPAKPLTGSCHVSNVDGHIFSPPPKGCLVGHELVGGYRGGLGGQHGRRSALEMVKQKTVKVVEKKKKKKRKQKTEKKKKWNKIGSKE